MAHMLQIPFNYNKCDISGMNMLKRCWLLGYIAKILTKICGKLQQMRMIGVVPECSDKHFRTVSFLISGVVLTLSTSKYKFNNVQEFIFKTIYH